MIGSLLNYWAGYFNSATDGAYLKPITVLSCSISWEPTWEECIAPFEIVDENSQRRVFA